MADQDSNICTVEEVIGKISEGDSSYAKYLARISWHGRPAELNVRYIDPAGKPRSGIALSAEEMDNLINMVVQMGYGDIAVLEAEIEKRKSRLAGNDEFFEEKE